MHKAEENNEKYVGKRESVQIINKKAGHNSGVIKQLR